MKRFFKILLPFVVCYGVTVTAAKLKLTDEITARLVKLSNTVYS